MRKLAKSVFLGILIGPVYTVVKGANVNGSVPFSDDHCHRFVLVFVRTLCFLSDLSAGKRTSTFPNISS